MLQLRSKIEVSCPFHCLRGINLELDNSPSEEATSWFVLEFTSCSSVNFLVEAISPKPITGDSTFAFTSPSEANNHLPSAITGVNVWSILLSCYCFSFPAPAVDPKRTGARNRCLPHAGRRQRAGPVAFSANVEDCRWRTRS